MALSSVGPHTGTEVLEEGGRFPAGALLPTWEGGALSLRNRKMSELCKGKKA